MLPPDRPFTAALLRVLPAGLLLVWMGGWRPRASEWGRLLILSALNIGAFQALLFVAAYRLPGGLAAVVGPVSLAGDGASLAAGQQASGGDGLVASLSGVAGMAALLLSPGSSWDGLGMLAAFGGAVSMACGTYLTRRWRLSAPVTALTGWQLALGGLMLLPLAMAIDPPLPSLGWTQVAGYAYLALFGALLAYLLWFRGIARLSPVRCRRWPAQPADRGDPGLGVAGTGVVRAIAAGHGGGVGQRAGGAVGRVAPARNGRG
ncbi:carboxylate/amino acid/amine transporter [Chromobacterium violaceum]|uniref:Carboxylate/amino acid/amine transporter n=1 Tax=Chromobacterium violaceum TaxID=536 RepID=A0A447TB26_CHRVL|nr:carboxylate/amino acid/amine transporter [Chromobacterium violaceum]